MDNDVFNSMRPEPQPSDANSETAVAQDNPMLNESPTIKSRRKDVIIETGQPSSVIEPPRIKIAPEDRFAIGVDLMMQITSALADLNTYQINLDVCEALYEGHVEDKQVPWPNSSNVFIPLTREMIDTMTARLAALVFQQRFVVVNGNTPSAAQVQAVLERYFNAEVARHNWSDPMFTWLFQSLLYGTGVMGVFWKRKISKRKRLYYEQAIDPDTGLPELDPDTGEPKLAKVLKSEPLVDYDDVNLVPIPLKEFIVFPVWSPTVDEALGCARKVRLSEQQLKAMVKAGFMWDEEVETVLNYHAQGIDERPEDFQGTYPVTADEQINISGGTPNVAPYRRQRGPVNLWQVHTSQYDLDNDGVFEEHIFWVHEESQRCIGHDPYKYWHGKRPFVLNVPMPRDQILFGFPMPMSILGLQMEMNTKENQKNDAIDRALEPVLVHTKGAVCLSNENKVGPGAEWEVDGEDARAGMVYLQTPEPPLSTWQEQQWLYERAMTLVGLNAPMIGAQSSGRRTAKEVSAQMASAGVRIDLMANRLRQSLQEIMNQVRELKIQYGPDEVQSTMVQAGIPQKFYVTKQMLAEDINISIVGAGGPLDRGARAQDMMILYTLLMQNPLVSQSMAKIYGVTQMMLEEHNRPDVFNLIGTPEEAAQIDQQRKLQQQVMQQMMAQNPQLMTDMMEKQKPQRPARPGRRR